MLDGLKTGLRAALKKIVNSSAIDEALIKELAKDIQRALLQSDVNVKLVFQITKNLEERSLKETPPPGLSRKDHIVKILYDELSKLLGTEKEVYPLPTIPSISTLFILPRWNLYSSSVPSNLQSSSKIILTK
jgi:signal recognition particle GTPase